MLQRTEEDSVSAQGGRLPAWRRRKAHREREILEAARALLEDCGYERASMTEIARRAGISEATVYNYFASKHDLIHQVIWAWMEPSLNALERDLRLVDGVPARLRLVATRHLREMAATPRLHRAIYSEVRWTDYPGSPMHRQNQRYARIVLRVLQDGIRDGELRADIDLRVARDMFFGGMEHTGWRLLLLGHEIDLEAAANTIVQQVLGGLAAAPSDGAATAVKPTLSGLLDRMEHAVAAMEGIATRHCRAGPERGGRDME